MSTPTDKESHSSTNMLPRLSESMTRICLAGFGGALAGLSISRRRGSFGAATPTILGTRRRGLLDDASSIREEMSWGALPMTWAVGCASFAGVLEASRYLEPTGMILSWFQQEKGLVMKCETDGSRAGEKEAKGFFHWDEASTKTLGDYSIAGAIAGAIFQGSRIQSTPSSNKTAQDSLGKSVAVKDSGQTKVPKGTAIQRRMIGKGKVIRLSKPSASGTAGPNIQSAMNLSPGKIPVKTGILSGLGPGLALGILAGACQILLHRLDKLTAHQQKEIEGTQEHEKEDEQIEKEIAEKMELVNNMSIVEIEQEIEKLKLQMSRENPSSSR